MAYNGIAYSSVQSPQHSKLSAINQEIDPSRRSNGHLSLFKMKFSSKGFWHLRGKLNNFVAFSRGHPISCHSTKTCNSETRERVRHLDDCPDVCRERVEDDHPVGLRRTVSSSQGLAEACKYVCNDAKFVNERARNDIVLLSRGIMRLDARARQDIAFLGTEFLKLDARAREGTEKIDHDVKRKAERLHHVAMILKNKAQSKLKSAADKHWSDGALEADLRRADFAAKQRAMEDALMALELVMNIHDMMVSKMYKFPSNSKRDSLNKKAEQITLEKNGKTLDFLPGEISADRITAIQDAYLSIASALSEGDGIDYTDPEELEFLVATLIDLDAMDGKSSVSLLAECSSSPNVQTRKALANALSAAPSMWTLGNAGMGALQRLAEDSNPAIAAAASRTINELKRQWEIEEGDNWRFMVNQTPGEEPERNEDNTD
ncbi:senescence-associated protein SPA15, chloroplastic isoform X1 [Coffea eugenioides]|uniref:senescence-associated protein SPA15, chloroplastic isoform X1 n=1 Tax=Coffea eugenioides TaxID=49369 RepID=UPI000F60FC82|nr:senescence-associated protein SPA15, chloroplastic isoform X1 [Coffea eugenioides]XP_027178756.1 senescence-associated protein SPA15, chloroplastic isoform X1 [Coffea eugenioides]